MEYIFIFYDFSILIWQIHTFYVILQRISISMSKQNPFVHLSVPDNPAAYNMAPSANYLSPRLLVIQDMHAINLQDFPFGLPILTQEYRLIRVLSGTMHLTINLCPYCLTAGTILISTPNSIVEIGERTDDFDMLLVAFKDLSLTDWYPHNLLLNVSQSLLVRIDLYIRMLHAITQNANWQDDTVRHMLMAMFSDLHADSSVQEVSSLSFSGSSGMLFSRFLQLLSEQGDKHRRISFYADQLAVTPNHLSMVIKSCSGQTVMDWINRRTIQQAKVLLRYSDDPIYSIAWQLGFENAAFFSQFFRRATGFSPKTFRYPPASNPLSTTLHIR